MVKVLHADGRCVILKSSNRRGNDMQENNKDALKNDTPTTPATTDTPVGEPEDAKTVENVEASENTASVDTDDVKNGDAGVDAPVADVAADKSSQPKETSITKKAALLWATAALVAGGAIGFAAYGSLNNQVIVSGGGLAITKSAMTNYLTNESSSVLYDATKSQALQKLYPQKVLASDAAAEKAANKYITNYIDNNGGKTVLSKSLKAQGTTLAKWRALVLPQAVAQVKSTAEAKQALAVIKDAGTVTDKEVAAEAKNYKLYTTNAYLATTQAKANKIASALKAGKKISSSDYSQHQNGLKISSVDNNSDSTDVLAKLKGSTKGDIVIVKLSSGSGYYVFEVKNSYSYKDYSKNNDKAGIKQINKAVRTSLQQQDALSSATLGKAEAKVLKAHDVHFKSKSLDKSFYSSLTTTTTSTTSTTSN